LEKKNRSGVFLLTGAGTLRSHHKFCQQILEAASFLRGRPPNFPLAALDFALAADFFFPSSDITARKVDWFMLFFPK
jgi:hypothetical protein